MDHELFAVSCDNAYAPQFSYTDEPVRVFACVDGGYFAEGTFGCGKTYDSPDAAIRETLRRHGCTNIRIRGEGEA